MAYLSCDGFGIRKEEVPCCLYGVDLLRADGLENPKSFVIHNETKM